MDYGASEFHVFRSGEKPKDDIKPLNHLLLCGSGSVDYQRYVFVENVKSRLVLTADSIIPLMDAQGTIYPLTVAFEPSPVSMLNLLFRGINIQGSLVASRDAMRSLLEFAARKNITPTIVTYPLNVEGIEKAMQDLRDGNVRYRAVLVRDFSEKRPDTP